MDLVMNHGAVELGKTALEQPSMAIYQLLEHYPASKIVIGVSIFVGFVAVPDPGGFRRGDDGQPVLQGRQCRRRCAALAANLLGRW